MKPPFRLGQGASLQDLEQALQGFAASCPLCPIGRLKLGLLGDFFALVPREPTAALLNFAARVVEEFDCFRTALSDVELQRRMKRPLDRVELHNLKHWGYPYVFERYRFHMTLTDRIPPQRQPDIQQQLRLIFQPLLAQEFSLDAIALFVQEAPDAAFTVKSRFALEGPARIGKPVQT